jgi:hypothetical protein
MGRSHTGSRRIAIHALDTGERRPRRALVLRVLIGMPYE